MTDDLEIDFAQPLEALNEALRDLRSEMLGQRALLMKAIDQGHALERHVEFRLLAIKRLGEVKDDLELTIRREMICLVGELDGKGA
ncbi:MAG TPA: hypothetical protein VFZ16_13125 [Hyphomicrobiaceae bacterium]|nr:hypothetical protein [Hyphomicrobiaceae bacterium]